MNVPIYRAKKIDSDEYLIGYLKFDRKHIHYSINPIDEDNTWHKIEENTLAIHFEDMIDSQGNNIFISLQEFGKGGDIITDGEYDFVVIFNGRSFDLMFVEDETFTKFNEWEDWNKFTKKGAKK